MKSGSAALERVRSIVRDQPDRTTLSGGWTLSVSQFRFEFVHELTGGAT
jgi:hypothetical protein